MYGAFSISINTSNQSSLNIQHFPPKKEVLYWADCRKPFLHKLYLFTLPVKSLKRRNPNYEINASEMNGEPSRASRDETRIWLENREYLSFL